MHDVSGLSNPAWHQVRQGCPTPDSCQASFIPVLVRLGARGVLVDKAQIGACRLLSPFQDVGLALHMVLSYMTRFNSSGLSNPYIHAAKVRRARSSRSSTGFFHCRIGTRGDVHSPSIRSVLTQSSSGLSNPHVQHTSLPGLSNPHVQKLYISVRVALASRISPVASCRLATPRNVCHCFHARSKLQPAHRMSAGWAVQPDAAGLSNPHIQTRAVQPILLRGWRV